jgi:catechol 2,3-dioxygenase-like lactoylglutathione lyase family enzyme
MKCQSAGPVLQVSDLSRSLKYYTEVLGFAEDFRFGEYAGVRNGDALLHLCAHTIHTRPIGGGAAFVICDEVENYHKEIRAKGAIVNVKPDDRHYGMKDFTVLDPDGNHINFGCETRRS